MRCLSVRGEGAAAGVVEVVGLEAIGPAPMPLSI
jgi:hypothetical protein